MYIKMAEVSYEYYSEKDEVIISKGDKYTIVPSSVARLQWLHHAPKSQESSRWIVLSVFTPEKIPAVFVRFTMSDGVINDTPAWVLNDSKVIDVEIKSWTPLFHKWSHLDNNGIAKIYKQYLKRLCRARQKDIDDRSQLIREHADDDKFINSLEYYTSQRVKLGCLKMKSESLEEALRRMESRLYQVTTILDEFAPGEHAAYVTPTMVEGIGVVDGWEEDPSQPCCPQTSDYFSYNEHCTVSASTYTDNLGHMNQC